MPCSLRNPTTEPVTLPYPFRGILNRGQGVMLDVTADECLALLGGSAFKGGLDINSQPAYVGAFDSFYLDPSTLVPPALEARAASTATITLTGPRTVDGVACVEGDLVLAKNQGTASQNGLYVVKATGIAWERSALMPAGAHVAGKKVQIAEGTANADLTFVCTSDAPDDIVGTSSLVFASQAAADALLMHLAGAETITGAKTFTGDVKLGATATVSANPTINKNAGQVSVAIGAATCTVTNSLVTATSIVLCVLQFVDATATQILSVVPGAGSFVITVNATATAVTKIGFIVINPA